MVSKMKNVKVLYDNVLFASKMERDYYIYLLNELKIPKSKIILQPEFILQEKFTDIEGKKHRAITYKSDFQIGDTVIDVKGMVDQKFPIKKKMFLKRYNSDRCMARYADNPLTLKVITKAPKWTGEKWIDLDKLNKLRRERKKNGI
jgi:hypothetical protein